MVGVGVVLLICDESGIAGPPGDPSPEPIREWWVSEIYEVLGQLEGDDVDDEGCRDWRTSMVILLLEMIGISNLMRKLPIREIDDHVAELKRLVAENPNDMARIPVLEQKIANWLGS